MMDSEQVKNINNTVNDSLSFFENDVIQNIARVFVFMFISQTAVDFPLLENFLTTPLGKVAFLTFGLWLGNKNFVLSATVSVGVITALMMLSGRRMM
jgi:hypothetical protein